MLLTVQTPSLAGTELARLESEWRALEARASGSFFQSWSWVGCCIAERFDAPVLVRAATPDGTTVGLALFNRKRLPLAPRALWLHQTGHPAEDAVYVEQNGPLVADGHGGVTEAILRTALRRAGVVVLGGVGDGVLQAASALGRIHVQAERPAPFADLAGRNGAAWLAARGASTRSQLRRSRMRLETLGQLAAQRAGSVPEALAFLAGLARLHQSTWTGRGLPGAFAEPAFCRFHNDLIARAHPRGEVALWRISAGERVVAYLYNLEWRGTVMSYQSGIDLEAAPRASPGLAAHAMAIEAAAQAGAGRYDFLAGDLRSKRELSDAAYALHWAELASAGQLRGVAQRLKRHLAAARPKSGSRAGR